MGFNANALDKILQEINLSAELNQREKLRNRER